MNCLFCLRLFNSKPQWTRCDPHILIFLCQIAAPDLKAVPIVAIVVQVLWDHIGVIEGLVHAVLAVLVVASWCHVSTRPPTSPIVPVFAGKFLGHRGWSRGHMAPAGNNK